MKRTMIVLALAGAAVSGCDRRGDANATDTQRTSADTTVTERTVQDTTIVRTDTLVRSDTMVKRGGTVGTDTTKRP
jgi:hypothetical protein